MTSKKGKAKPGITIEGGFLKNMYVIKPPLGYKWKLWSFGQYGLHVILIKLEADRDE